ncbi:nuclear transport factor 2 family protein [uncultured Tenacibaculum sp.]|uniref:nuclear transport factor 2 family protein n=1 Tax=uncultured Tenacibaculum sp. TaxID=174713 RepID=UPI0026229AF3|nr:nuclear transport factor 2 family protein [uncultured Tenacibaculum sp.]
MKNTKQSITVVQEYFEAFQQGNMEKVLNIFHEDCLIISVRKEDRRKDQLHGTYKTKENAKQFLQNIVNQFDTIEFIVEEIIADKQVVFANGKFKHQIKTTSKMFISDWVQRCIIEDSKIKEYQFYEDSAAFVEASQL